MGVVLARLLGAKDLGQYALALSVASIITGFALLGMNGALVRYVALYRSRGDVDGVWNMLQVGIGLPSILGLLLAIGLFAASRPIAEQVFDEPGLVPMLQLISVAVPLITLTIVLADATRGFNTMQYAAIANNISQPGIKLLLIVVLAITGLSVAKALTAHVLSVAVAAAMLLYFLNRLFPLRRRLAISQGDWRDIFRFALPSYGAQLVLRFRGDLSIQLLGALDAVSSVGIYTVASQINVVGSAFGASITTASMPIISELVSQGEHKPLARLYQTLTKWTFSLSLPLFLIVLLFPELLLSIFGEDFVGGASALVVLALANLIAAATTMSDVVLGMSGHTTLQLVNAIVSVLIVLALNALLITRWGLLGAAMAFLAFTLIMSLVRVTQVYYLLRLSPYNLSFLKPIVAGLVTLAIAAIARQALQATADILTAALTVLVILVAYVSTILLLGLSEEDRMVLARMRRRVVDLFG
jgi:O-antigen/teichoic acid export membrane protein